MQQKVRFGWVGLAYPKIIKQELLCYNEVERRWQSHPNGYSSSAHLDVHFLQLGSLVWLGGGGGMGMGDAVAE